VHYRRCLSGHKVEADQRSPMEVLSELLSPMGSPEKGVNLLKVTQNNHHKSSPTGLSSQT
jgi:hypothetical protein